jgi:hypothetical protein
MQFRMPGRNGRLFSRALIALLFSGAATHASAQTTVTLNQPATQVVSATIRGGSYADKTDQSLLATRSSDDFEYFRRALLKFDTENTIPAGSVVTSALLTVTVKTGSEDASRSIGAYQVTTSWTETEVTWNRRKAGTNWTTKGGDLGSRLDDATVSNAAGTKVPRRDAAGEGSGCRRRPRVPDRAGLKLHVDSARAVARDPNAAPGRSQGAYAGLKVPRRAPRHRIRRRVPRPPCACCTGIRTTTASALTASSIRRA